MKLVRDAAVRGVVVALSLMALPLAYKVGVLIHTGHWLASGTIWLTY